VRHEKSLERVQRAKEERQDIIDIVVLDVNGVWFTKSDQDFDTIVCCISQKFEFRVALTIKQCMPGEALLHRLDTPDLVPEDGLTAAHKVEGLVAMHRTLTAGGMPADAATKALRAKFGCKSEEGKKDQTKHYMVILAERTAERLGMEKEEFGETERGPFTIFFNAVIAEGSSLEQHCRKEARLCWAPRAACDLFQTCWPPQGRAKPIPCWTDLARLLMLPEDKRLDGDKVKALMKPCGMAAFNTRLKAVGCKGYKEVLGGPRQEARPSDVVSPSSPPGGLMDNRLTTPQ